MKFSAAYLATAFLGLTSAADLPARFSLVLDGGAQVLTDSEHIFKAQSAETPEGQRVAIFNGGKEPSRATDEESKSDLFVDAQLGQPVGFTVPHPDGPPEDGQQTGIVGFSQDDEGQFLFEGQAGFGIGENNEIIWAGPGDSAVKVSVKEQN